MDTGVAGWRGHLSGEFGAPLRVPGVCGGGPAPGSYFTGLFTRSSPSHRASHVPLADSWALKEECGS